MATAIKIPNATTIVVVLSPVLTVLVSNAKQLIADITIKTNEHRKEIKTDNLFNSLYPFTKIIFIARLYQKAINM